MAFLRELFPTAVTNDITLEIALGNIPGFIFFRKFFENPDAGLSIADVWDYAGTEPLYTYTANTGADYYLCSSDNADVGQVVRVSLLDENFNPRTVFIPLQGHTPIKINTGFLCTRVYRLFNVTPALTAGTVYCVEGAAITSGVPDDTEDVRAVISIGSNITLMSHFTVPADYCALFTQGWASITKKQSVAAEVDIYLRTFGGSFGLITKQGCNTIGSTDINRSYQYPPGALPKSDLVFRASASAACGISGEYNLVIVKEEFINRASNITL